VQTPFNLCVPCAIEERHTDETDSTDKHRNDFQLCVFDLTLSLCDVPLLSQGEGRFGNAKTG
jgi:hypothetical protein